MNEEQERMKELIVTIEKTFPLEDGGFTSAVFFHHDKNGKLEHASPLFSFPDELPVSAMILVTRMQEYSRVCQEMAIDIIRTAKS